MAARLTPNVTNINRRAATPQMNVVVNNNAPNTEARAEQRDGKVYVTVDEVRQIVASDMRRGGNLVSNSIEQTYKMSRVR